MELETGMAMGRWSCHRGLRVGVVVGLLLLLLLMMLIHWPVHRLTSLAMVGVPIQRLPGLRHNRGAGLCRCRTSNRPRELHGWVYRGGGGLHGRKLCRRRRETTHNHMLW